MSFLFISHIGRRCGVHQFGDRMFTALSNSRPGNWLYKECDTIDDFQTAVDQARPEIILFNYHPSTLTWADSMAIRRAGIPLFAVWHEANQEQEREFRIDPFDFLICADPTLEPTRPQILSGPRFIPSFGKRLPQNEIFTVGSFGFASANKRFHFMCKLVNDQFERAKIKINIPFHDSNQIIPQTSIQYFINECRNAISKPNIELEITHQFWDEAELLDFLAGNDLNIFVYDEQPCRGISSCIDYALSVGRPIAVSRSSMFRPLHLCRPSVCVEDRSLNDIWADGPALLEPMRHAFSESVAGETWNRILENALHISEGAPAPASRRPASPG